MEMIAPSYKSAGSHVTKDIEICDELYIIYSDNKEILAFFMFGFHKVKDLDCCYLGLSACRQEYKANGLVKALYLEFAKNCKTVELAYKRRLLCYWTTATPIVYNWFNKHFRNVEPDKFGNCTEKGLETLYTIATERYEKAKFDINIPYVLRHAAKGINYSDEENQRIEKAIIDLNLPIFNEFNLDEKNGDRFLMIGFCPD